VRTYVHGRIMSSRVRRVPSARSRTPETRSPRSVPNENQTHFRYTRPPSPNIQDLAFALEMPKFGLWMNELWHDFLIESTPYLVASAICYVGGVLILVQYHWAIWWLARFFFRLLPWDDDLEFG
jgi:hypothetical protein